MIATCENCGKVHRYNSGEIENAGTIWHPIWTVRCPSCHHRLTFDHGVNGSFDIAQISRSKDGVSIRAPSRRSGHERARSGDIREYWLQQYIRDNFAILGFSKLDGPFERGPDFSGVYKGRKVIVEAERTCKSFVQHSHHKDPRFRDVDILIVLGPSDPPEELKKYLPDTIIRIDIDDFVKYWRPKARAYAKDKRIQGILDLIAGEVQRRFIRDCLDKDRDMSTCPECELCPYFGEGTGEASSLFRELSLRFIVSYKHPIHTDAFNLSSIKPGELDEFYERYVRY